MNTRPPTSKQIRPLECLEEMQERWKKESYDSCMSTFKKLKELICMIGRSDYMSPSCCIHTTHEKEERFKKCIRILLGD